MAELHRVAEVSVALSSSSKYDIGKASSTDRCIKMWDFEYNRKIDDSLKLGTGCGQFLPGDLPEALVNGALKRPLWLMTGRVQQWWRSAEEHGVDLGPEISVAINDSTRVNAFALPDKKTPIITISAGTCIRLRQLMHQVVWTMAAGPFTMRGPEGNIVDGQLLSASLGPDLGKEIFAEIDLRPGRDEISYLNYLLPVAPTEKRMHLADALTLSAFDFLIMHEIVHIVRRQSRFLPSASASFFEGLEGGGAFSVENLAAEEPFLREILELEADCFAASASATQFGGLEEMIPLWQKWTDDIEEVQNLWLISLALLFSFLDAWSTRSVRETRTHPPAGVRLLGATTIFFDRNMPEFSGGVDVQNWPQEAQQVGWKVYSALEQTAHLWEVFNLPKASGRIVTKPKGFKSLQKDFNSYRGRLEKFNQRREIN
jgi:hypothetical protein